MPQTKSGFKNWQRITALFLVIIFSAEQISYAGSFNETLSGIKATLQSKARSSYDSAKTFYHSGTQSMRANFPNVFNATKPLIAGVDLVRGTVTRSSSEFYNSWTAINRQALPNAARAYDSNGSFGAAFYGVGLAINPVIEKVTGIKAGSVEAKTIGQTLNKWVSLPINIATKLSIGKDLAKPYVTANQGLGSITPGEAVLGVIEVGFPVIGKGVIFLAARAGITSTSLGFGTTSTATKAYNYAKWLPQVERYQGSLAKNIGLTSLNYAVAGELLIGVPTFIASTILHATGHTQARDIVSAPNMFVIRAFVETHDFAQGTLGRINSNTIKTDIGDKIWNAQYGKLGTVTKAWDKIDNINKNYWVKNIGDDNYKYYLKPAARTAGMAVSTLASGVFGARYFLGGAILAITSGITADPSKVANKQPYVQLIVNSSIKDGINGSLTQYADDLKKEGYKVNIIDDRDLKTPQDLRSHLKNESARNNLAGAVLIGDLPVVKYNILNNTNTSAAPFPTDLYFMNLNGDWQDVDKDGVLDTHPLTGNKNIDIFIGRIPASPFSSVYSSDIIERNGERDNLIGVDIRGKINLSEFKTIKANISTTSDIDFISFYFADGGIGISLRAPKYFGSTQFTSPDSWNIEIPLNASGLRDAKEIGIEIHKIDGAYTKINRMELIGKEKEMILYPQNVLPNQTKEITILNDYFKKNHEFRSGNLSKSNNALLYIDDDWHNWHEDNTNIIRLAYDNVADIHNPNQTTAKNYLQEIQTGNYDWVSLSAHSSAYEHFSGDLKSEEIKGARPYFYSLFACSAADYTQPNFMAGSYLFGEGNQGLVSIGSTKAGSMINSNSFYEGLQKGNNIGEAFRDWANNNELFNDGISSDGSLGNFGWSAGEVIIGDPTLRPVNSISSAVGSSSPKNTYTSIFPFRRVSSNVSIP